MKVWLYFAILAGCCGAGRAVPAPLPLPNLGNTCYANALIQVLHNLQPFVDELFVYDEQVSQKPLAKQFLALVEGLESVRLGITPQGKKYPYEGLLDQFYDAAAKAVGKERGEMWETRNVFDALEQSLRPLPVMKPFQFSLYAFELGSDVENFIADFQQGMELYLQTHGKVGLLPAIQELLEFYARAIAMEETLRTVGDIFVVDVAAHLDSGLALQGISPNLVIPTFDGAKSEFDLVGVVLFAGAHYYAYINDLFDAEETWYYCSDGYIKLIGKTLGYQDVADLREHGSMFFYVRKSRVQEIRAHNAERNTRVEDFLQGKGPFKKQAPSVAKEPLKKEDPALLFAQGLRAI